MEDTQKYGQDALRVCVEECKGLCCDPWWGIIDFTAVKSGASHWDAFSKELTSAIEARAKRIIDAYITKEDPPRRLFSTPVKYTVAIRDIKGSGGKIEARLVAMYAFVCAFLDANKACALHPTIFNGVDIRPHHCNDLGRPSANPNERGYCRIIHAAVKGTRKDVLIAIEQELSVSKKHITDGHISARSAAEAVVERLKYWAAENTRVTPPQRPNAPGRNDPCPCGSGKKFKKCCGG